MSIKPQTAKGIEYLRNIFGSGKFFKLKDPVDINNDGFTFLFELNEVNKKWNFSLSREVLDDLPAMKKYQESVLKLTQDLELRFRNYSPDLFLTIAGRLLEIQIEWPIQSLVPRPLSSVPATVKDFHTGEFAYCLILITHTQSVLNLKTDPFQIFEAIINTIRVAIDQDSIAMLPTRMDHPDQMQEINLQFDAKHESTVELSRYLKQKVYLLGFRAQSKETRVWLDDPWDADYLGISPLKIRQESEILEAERYFSITTSMNLANGRFASATDKLLLELKNIENENMNTVKPLSTITVISKESGSHVEWEKIMRLGGGGQSDVFLVRTPQRTKERAQCLEILNSYGSHPVAADVKAKLNVDFASSIQAYHRSDLPSELGAMKIFKVRDAGPEGEQQALNRLKQEIEILKQNRVGLPKLLSSNDVEGWIVTEYFPELTLEHQASKYKGNVELALKAFRSLAITVTALHNESIVHRDIKPANVFIRKDDDLVLGDFGIVFLPNQQNRLTRTNESVGPGDYMPPWADVGIRLENVTPSFDVYMMGKLLWCMVSGRLWLQREWFDEPENNLTIIFSDNPHMYMINTILAKCVVPKSQQCLSSARELLAMVNAFIGVLERGGQLLKDGIPRPCHICGIGNYQQNILRQNSVPYHLRLWNITGGASDINTVTVRVFVCDNCGHMELFRQA